MVFTTAGGGANQLDTGYDIENSLRFNDGDSAQLNRSFTADPDSRKKFTISFWAKRGDIEGDNAVFGARTTANFWSRLHFDSSYRIRLQNVSSGSTDVEFEATPKLRDPSAWYHIVFAVDTTQSSLSDGVKLYINGERITDASSTNFTQNATFEFARNGTTTYVGHDNENSSFYDGYLSELYYVDNQQLAPTAFGETNDNGVWIPIDAKDDITFGANGFYLEFKQTGTSQDSSGIGADTSGNDEHFAVSNLAATDVTTDTPTNNFCTLNPLHKSTTNVELSEGNLRAYLNQSTGWQHAAGTMAVQNGKWYWEAKATTVSASDKTSIGVVEFDTDGVNFVNNTNKDIINQNTAGITGHGAGVGSYSYSQGDIINVAMDMDNNKIYYGKNNTYFGTLDPAAGSGSTTQTVDNSRFSVPVVGGYGGSVWEMNFGVPQFSISSGNADANGYGNFEYAPPSGFYSLCTKNLAEYG